MRKSLLVVTTLVFALVSSSIQAQSLISTVQLDLPNQIMVAIGSNLGPNPTVFMGAPTGALDQLNVTDSGPSFVVADLVTTTPGTYVVVVVNGPSVGFANVTIGPQGPEGPAGPPGPDNPNIITEIDNTGLGVNALANNTTGLGNTATGGRALFLNSTGSRNTSIGEDALLNNSTGNDNTAEGNGALFANTTGNDNTAVGNRALFLSSGGGNTATGDDALSVNTTGNNNTAVGKGALFANTTGSHNTAIGFQAGFNAAFGGDNNIYIANPGQFLGSGVIMIGEQGIQTSTFIAGISGATTVPGSTVFIDTNGKLGTIASSRRFKQDIHDMDSASSALMHLRPVTFRYKKAYANGERPLQYGLIAEEVAEVYPELVVHNDEGQVQTVQYHKLNSMLLNEVQKQHRQIQRQDERIQVQKEQLADLMGRLARLEQVLATQHSLAAVK